jgi:hypothetical protein
MRRPLGFALRSVRLPGGPPRTSARPFDPSRHAQTRSRKAEGTRDPRKSRRSDEEDLAPPLQDRSVPPPLIGQAAGPWSNGWVIDLCAVPSPQANRRQCKPKEPKSRTDPGDRETRQTRRRRGTTSAGIRDRSPWNGVTLEGRIVPLGCSASACRKGPECRMVTIERPLRGAWGRLYAAGCVTSATGWRTNAA